MSQVRPVFPNYMQMRQPLPIRVWHLLRLTSVVAALAICALLFAQPAIGLRLFWGLLIPLVPLLFFVAPGLWRNLCPLAALNQTPRVLGLTRALPQPPFLRNYGYLVAIGLFLVLVPARKALFNVNGPASAVLILLALAGAFVGGLYLKGKSGWCSSICPLLPVQRIYGQTPWVTIPNSHCQPCVGCTKNCYDFNPPVAYLADLHDDDRYFAGYRKLFVGLFPGFILAFYTLPNPPAISILQLYLGIALYSVVSAGLYYVLDSLVKVSANKLTALFGGAALNVYYWFSFPILAQTILAFTGVTVPDALVWAGRAAVLGLTLLWVARTYRKEALFIQELRPSDATRLSATATRALSRALAQKQATVTFAPDNLKVAVEPGRTLLEIAESNRLPIEAGCRMGMCGADAVTILEGMENLSPLSQAEQTTLERLGVGKQCRMACMARVNGPVSVSLKPERATATAVVATDFDPTIKRLVIIGNGIAGVTAADHVRRRHPECEIHLVGREHHHLYNRMGISRLIYGRSAMQGLYLLPDAWYDEHKISCWLNTHVETIQPEAKQVVLATGETLPYDRLILATGSRSLVPSIPGYGLPGTFVLREAEDAMAIRAFVQQHKAREGVITGGGLLGLEAAYALHKLGVMVTVLERSDRLLRRQLDVRGADFLREHLEQLGLTILMNAETASLQGNGRLTQVVLKDGRILDADLFLVAAGIQPNTELARSAGIAVKRGVLVDDHLRTNLPDVYAIGDLAEHRGELFGLWPVAVEQAEVAAVNALGGDRAYQGYVPSTMLKVVGVDLTSIGRFQPASEAEIVIALENAAEKRYRKLVIADGRIVGAILMGYPLDVPPVQAAIQQGVDVSGHLDALRAGDWTVLSKLVR